MTEEYSLVERARNGETAAFRDLVERYKKKIYFLALDLTGNHHDAEDLSQEVFLKAYRSMKGFRGDAQFGSWLYRIAVNTNINQHRKKAFTALKPQECMEEMNQDQISLSRSGIHGDPETQADAGLIRKHIDRAMDRLSPHERCVFVLRHYNDFPLKDIAEIMSISKGTVKSTLFRTLKKLQKELSFYRQELGLETSHE
ncbi:MAG: sigma-70 family RNA polymerase sigma factor [bacterium]